MIQSAINKRSAAVSCHIHTMADWKSFSKQFALESRDTPLHAVFVLADACRAYRARYPESVECMDVDWNPLE